MTRRIEFRPNLYRPPFEKYLSAFTEFLASPQHPIVFGIGRARQGSPRDVEEINQIGRVGFLDEPRFVWTEDRYGFHFYLLRRNCKHEYATDQDF